MKSPLLGGADRLHRLKREGLNFIHILSFLGIYIFVRPRCALWLKNKKEFKS